MPDFQLKKKPIDFLLYSINAKNLGKVFIHLLYGF